MKKYFALCFIIIIQSLTAEAQLDHTIVREDTAPKYIEDNEDLDNGRLKQSYFKAGINYVSDNVYLGRKDTFKVPYITPYLGYYDKTGLYARALLSYTNKHTDPHLDLFTLEAGYNNTFLNRLSVGAVADKYFYSGKSTSIKAYYTDGVSAYISYSNTVLEPVIFCDINIAKNSDYIAGGGLDHSFYLLDDKLSIIPTATFSLGTEHYFEYYINKIMTKKSKKNPVKETVVNANDFQLLAYDLSLPVAYKYHNFDFFINPQYAFPLNAATIRLNKKDRKETLTNSFFIEMEIEYKIGVHNKQKGSYAPSFPFDKI